jgi:hypothetical protein
VSAIDVVTLRFLLNQGRADPAALQELRQIGTRQVVVVNQPSVYRPGQWRSVVGQLVASGDFPVVVSDGPWPCSS